MLQQQQLPAVVVVSFPIAIANFVNKHWERRNVHRCIDFADSRNAFVYLPFANFNCNRFITLFGEMTAIKCDLSDKIKCVWCLAGIVFGLLSNHSLNIHAQFDCHSINKHKMSAAIKIDCFVVESRCCLQFSRSIWISSLQMSSKLSYSEDTQLLLLAFGRWRNFRLMHRINKTPFHKSINSSMTAK